MPEGEMTAPAMDGKRPHAERSPSAVCDLEHGNLYTMKTANPEEEEFEITEIVKKKVRHRITPGGLHVVSRKALGKQGRPGRYVFRKSECPICTQFENTSDTPEA